VSGKPRLLARKRLVLLGDLFLIIVAVLGSFALRLDLGPLFIDYLDQAFWLVGIALVVKPLIFYTFGLYRRLWAYASIHELLLIIVAVTTSSVMVSVAVVVLLTLNVLPNFPRGVLPIDWLLSLVLIGGLRFSLRILAETQSTSAVNGGGCWGRRSAGCTGNAEKPGFTADPDLLSGRRP
jgi:FlaA1/EpsC-like NDP-sugar epimerase